MKHRTLWVALGIKEAHAQHTDAEGECLSRWARGRRALVEVGVAEGASAATVRREMDPKADLWLVDPFNLSRNPLFNTGLAAARRTVSRVKRGRVHFVVKTSAQALAAWNRPLDFVFIDADHSYDAVMRDWAGWSRHLTPNGVVAFHDAVEAPGHPNGPVRVVNELFRERPAGEWMILEERDTLVVVGSANR